MISWSVWLVRKILSLRYRPVVNAFRATTSVVVPSFHEDPQVLVRCLDTWLAQNPTEVIVVLWSLITMNTQGWLTRRADLIGGEGQDEASLMTGDARGAL